MVFKAMLVASLAVAGIAQAQYGKNKFEVSQRQLDHLLEHVQKLEQKNRRIGNDFGSAEVMPRERDRRDFLREMGELQDESSLSITRWIERVKSNDIAPPITPPVLVAPADLTLAESFVENTGYAGYYAEAFTAAGQRALKLCEAWRKQVTSNTVGQIVYAQCSGAEQSKFEDGKIGARVNGSLKISFANFVGYEAPRTLTTVYTDNTGYAGYYEEAYQTALKNTQTACTKWTTDIKAMSKGVTLHQNCGAPKLTKGFDGKLWVSIAANVSYTHRPSKSQPTVLSQSFTNSTGYAGYYAEAVKTASAQSEAQCLAWARDTIKNSTAMPVIASCGAAEVLQNGKLDIRVPGVVVLLTP